MKRPRGLYIYAAMLILWSVMVLVYFWTEYFK